jgi:hypothetical protein
VLSYGAALLLGLMVFLVSLNRHTAYYDKLLSPPEEAREMQKQEREIQAGITR